MLIPSRARRARFLTREMAGRAHGNQRRQPSDGTYSYISCARRSFTPQLLQQTIDNSKRAIPEFGEPGVVRHDQERFFPAPHQLEEQIDNGIACL